MKDFGLMALVKAVKWVGLDALVLMTFFGLYTTEKVLPLTFTIAVVLSVATMFSFWLILSMTPSNVRGKRSFFIWKMLDARLAPVLFTLFVRSVAGYYAFGPTLDMLLYSVVFTTLSLLSLVAIPAEKAKGGVV